MPLVGEFHSFFWEDQGEAPPDPSNGLLLLLGVGRAVVWFLPPLLFLLMGAS